MQFVRNAPDVVCFGSRRGAVFNRNAHIEVSITKLSAQISVLTHFSEVDYKMDKVKYLPVRHANIAITYKCNAKCKHCSINADDVSNKRLDKEMSTDEIKHAIKQLYEAGVMFLGIAGGEALLHEDIYEIVKFSKKNDMFTSIASNGLIMDDAIAKELKKCDLDGFLISLDHTDFTIHDKIRGVDGIFEKAVDAIKICVENGFYVSMGITPMRDNIGVFADLVEKGVQMGVKGITFSSFVPTGRGRLKDDLTPVEWGEFYVLVRKLTKQYEGKVNIHFHDPRLNVLGEQTSSINGISGCLAGINHCYILPDGTVNPCVMLPKSIGNIKDGNLRDILRNYQNDEKVFERSNLIGKCGGCKYKSKCGGCRAVAYAYTSNYNEADRHCWIKT